MRITITLLLISICSIATATDYYIKNGGTDVAAGTSDATAWATIDKVNSFAFKPGDRILFKRGNTWREQKPLATKSGTNTGNITYSSYDTGAKPLILGSKQENLANDWMDLGGGLWTNSDPSFATQVSNIIFNNEASCGIRVKTLGELTSQGKFYYDATNKRITLYSTSNPASYYTNIECALGSNILLLSSYVTIDGLDIRYGGRHGINASSGKTNITIRNCNVSWMGGMFDGNVRLGNGIEFWGSASNILIEKNYIDQCFDDGVTNQYYNNALTVSNFIIRYNIINRCENAFTWMYKSTTGTVTEFYFQNNTCINSGNGYSHNQRWGNGPWGRAINNSEKDVTITNSYIRNNILSVAAWAGIKTYSYWLNGGVTWDYNLFYVNSIGRIDGTYYTTLAQYQSASSQESHSKSDNPNFVSITDFRLLSSSPCVNKGISVGYTDDFDGNPIIGNPDIGAFEYQPAAGSLPVYLSSVVENTSPSNLTMNYDLTLANIVPAAASFTVLVNSATRTVSSVAVSGTKVQLTLASPVVFGDVVTVAYNKPATNPLQTPAGDQAVTISARTVTNNVNPVSPVYVSATVGNATPAILEITYNLTLANIVTAASAFTVLVNSATRTVNSVAISGTKVLLTLSSPVVYGNIITVAYNRPATNPLQTPSGGQAATLSTQAVTNNVNAVNPVYVSAAIENATPSVLEVTYNLTLANIVPSASAFTVLVNSVARTVNTVAVSGTKILLTLANPVVYGNVVTIAYNKPATDPLQTASGGQAVSITAQSVTNKVSPVNPVYVSSAIENASPSTLEMTYNLTLAGIISAASAFTVLVNSIARTVNTVAVSGTKVLLTLSSPVVYGDVITVAYSKPATNPLQTASGGQAVTISAQTVTNKVNPVSPVYLSSSVENAAPSILEMTYNLTLANIIPAASEFTVLVNSVVRTVNAVAVSGTRARLTLADPVVYGDVITVSYNKPVTNPLQTPSGGQAATISAQAVTNNVYPPDLIYISSAIENATPSILEMSYNLTLANIIPATASFAVLVNSVARTVNSVVISGTKVLLTLSSPVVYGNVVTVSYSKPVTDPLQTPAGEQAVTISAQAVNNKVNQVSPVYVSSAIENVTPAILEMTYNLTLANSVPAPSAFTVLVNSAAMTVNTVAVSGTKVLLTLASPVVYGSVVTVAYNKPTANQLKTSSGGEAATIAAQTVTNKVNPVSPVYLSSAIGNTTPSILEMTYNLALANIIPAAVSFTVIVNSAARTVNSVAVSGTKVLLTLATPVVYGNVVTVAYNKPATNPLQTASGGQAETISAKPVTNNVNPANPIYVSSAVANDTPTILEMTYNLTLANIVPAAPAFTVLVNSVSRTVNTVVVSGSKVLLTLAGPVVYGDIITITYNKPATNPLQTASGGQAVSITAQSVTNNVNPVNPVYVSSAIENATPSKLEMTYNLALANIVPAASVFTVMVNTVTRTVNTVTISGTKVLLTLASPVVYGNVVTVSYTRPATGQLQSTSGTLAQNITNQPVTNKCLNPGTPNAPPVPVLSYETDVFSGFVYEIDASGSNDPNNDILTFEWTAPANVSVSSTTSSKIRFLAPVVITQGDLEFKLKVNDGRVTVLKSIPIVIKPYKQELAVARITNIEASSYQPPDYPDNIVDENLSTKWSASGVNQWLLFKLAEPFKISHLELAFLQGQKYESYFDVYASKDNQTWEPILLNTRSCNFSGDRQFFDFPAINVNSGYSYLKLTGYGNSLTTWNSFSELKIYGSYSPKSTSDNNKEKNIVIYPNPSTGLFNISIEEATIKPQKIRVIDFSGSIVFEDDMSSPGIKTVQLPESTDPGFYLLQLMSGNVILFVEKLIIK